MPNKHILLSTDEISAEEKEKEADANASPEVIVSITDSKIQMHQLQQLLLWVLADGINPSWVFVKFKAMIPSAVILLVDGLSERVVSDNANTMLLAALPKEFERFNVGFRGSKFDKFAILKSIWNVSPDILADDDDLKKNLKKRKISPAGESESNLEEVIDRPIEELIQIANQTTGFLLEEAQLRENKYQLEEEMVIQHSNTQETVLFTSTDHAEEEKAFVALDCEMCITDRGYDLTRLSLVDSDGSVLIDMLVVPDIPIRDYNTRYTFLFVIGLNI
jgi:RNA exonuclease 1